MKYCLYCGAGLRDDMGFCPTWGKKYLGAVSSTEEQNIIEETVVYNDSSSTNDSTVEKFEGKLVERQSMATDPRLDID